VPENVRCSRKSVVAWWLYDWANSAFILTVSAGFFPVFFKSFWCTGVDATISTARLGYGNAAAGLMVAVFSPFLGAIADLGRAKKKLLATFALLGCCTTFCLYYVPQGAWFSALLLYLFASVGYNSANIFYDALLVDIADKERMDAISATGYSLGYLGCGLLFLVNVLMVKAPERFGLPDATAAVRIAFVMASLWWFLFSLPLFRFVPERDYTSNEYTGNLFRSCLNRTVQTGKKIISDKGLLLFLLAYWLYIDGVHTVVFMAVDFGMSIGIKPSSLMIALLVVQFVGLPSSYLFGRLAERFGPIPMIITGNIIYLLICFGGALFLRNPTQYIVMGGFIGLAQGGIQALSRSCFGKMIPPDASAEYFGFFNIVSRFAIIIGPAILGTIVLLTKSAGLSSVSASRVGMSSLTLLFIGGSILLLLSKRQREAQI
jgi:MFS transporter, UMF1 family